jgi:hypothetical protein
MISSIASGSAAIRPGSIRPASSSRALQRWTGRHLRQARPHLNRTEQPKAHPAIIPKEPAAARFSE